MTLSQLQALFADKSCTKLFAKLLSANDNSKNQIYFGPDFQALNLFPIGGVYPDHSKKNPIFKVPTRFSWMSSKGSLCEVSGAQIILYPQYPEVRFSGFLRGCPAAPSELMVSRQPGRVLFLGITTDRRILGFVVPARSEIASEFRSKFVEPTSGVFFEVPLPNAPDEARARSKLLSELRRISRSGWIDSKQLSSDGTLKPCNAPQCGGFTLEAELGIAKNSLAAPDYLGWEVKQHNVSNFHRPQTGTITLFTPEPDGGYYKTKGPEAFVRRFGYADKHLRVDRLNFGGVHKAGKRHALTKLTLSLEGYDEAENVITNALGSLALVCDSGVIAASWTFSSLIAKWTTKHAKAAYVPSKCRKEPQRQYAYGGIVRLAVGTDFLRFLRAMAEGLVFYDPGIKLESASSNPKVKRRSQFRVASKDVAALYETLDLVTL